MQTNWQIDKFVTVLEKKQVYFIILPPSICLHLIYLLTQILEVQVHLKFIFTVIAFSRIIF